MKKMSPPAPHPPKPSHARPAGSGPGPGQAPAPGAKPGPGPSPGKTWKFGQGLKRVHIIKTEPSHMPQDHFPSPFDHNKFTEALKINKKSQILQAH